MKDLAFRRTVVALLIAAIAAGLAVDKYGHRNYGGAAEAAGFAVFTLGAIFCMYMSKLIDALHALRREQPKVLEKDSQDIS